MLLGEEFAPLAVGCAIECRIDLETRFFVAHRYFDSLVMSAGAKLGHSTPRERRSAAE